MTIKDLIEKLNTLPQDATIGTLSWDENDQLHGRSCPMIRKNGEQPDEIEAGDKHLDYYIEC